MSGARKLSHFVCNLYACGRQWKGQKQRQWQVGEWGREKGEQGNRGTGELGTVCAEHAAPQSTLTETLANFHWCAALFVISGQPFSIAMHFGHFYIFTWFLFAFAFTFTFAFRVVFLVARRVARFAARLHLYLHVCMCLCVWHVGA